ncbi:MAG: hypothetical protein KGI38_11755 [Thaumarchaeota archaeon]|nr:hypothetical protein [Nitrososphaerota archaeon]
MSYQVQETPLCAKCIVHIGANLHGLDSRRTVPSLCECPDSRCEHHRN